MNRIHTSLLLTALFLALAPTAPASSTWYVNGVSGSDSNPCTSPTSACKTIGHAISLASSGDSIMVAAATYYENLTIGINLNLVGSGANTAIIDGGSRGTVLTISSATAYVTLSRFTVQNGRARFGAGIFNSGTLKIINSTVRNNMVSPPSTCFFGCNASGGGIYNNGTLTISNSTVGANTASTPKCRTGAAGGGIYNQAMLTVNNSSLNGNSADATCVGSSANGGAVGNSGTVMINNSTITGNTASAGGTYTSGGGGIENQGSLTISNVTLSANSAPQGSGIQNFSGYTTALQNSIIANNAGGDCSGTMTSNGYNVSSDSTCNFSGPGDLNNTDPKLGTLGYYGGPTQTVPLLSGSPAIDAGNPSGCTDGQGHLLKSDQRGMPRPDPEDAGGCDMGAYERQTD